MLGKDLHLTAAGIEILREGKKLWAQAQKRFERAFGRERASELRAELGAVTASDLP
jgi:hypothetical protein